MPADNHPSPSSPSPALELSPAKVKGLARELAMQRATRQAQIQSQFAQTAAPIRPEQIATLRDALRERGCALPANLDWGALYVPTAAAAPPSAVPPAPTPAAVVTAVVTAVDAILALARQCSQPPYDWERAQAAYWYLILKRKKLAQVLADLETLTQEFPRSVRWWQLLGEGYMRVNQLPAALAAYHQALHLLEQEPPHGVTR